MSASALRQPCPPGACVCERERLEAPGADRRILLLTTGRAAPGRSLWKPCAAWKTWNTCCGAWRNNWASACGSPRPSARCAACAASACASRSSRGSAARPARRFPPPSAAAWRSAGSRLRPAQRPRPARRLKALNDRKRMSLKTSAGFRYRRITPTALFALQAAADAGEPPGPPESLAGLATAPGFSSPTPPARRRTSPAGGAGRHRTGCAVRQADAGEDFHAARIGAAQGLLQLAGTAGEARRQRWKRCP